jgi:hypothetical protein
MLEALKSNETGVGADAFAGKAGILNCVEGAAATCVDQTFGWKVAGGRRIGECRKGERALLSLGEDARLRGGERER